jgi:hypothetical protein
MDRSNSEQLPVIKNLSALFLSVTVCLILVAQAANGMTEPRTFKEFVQAMPDSEHQSAFRLERPVWLDQESPRLLEQYFAQSIEKDSFGKLTGQLAQRKLALQHIWIWTDLSRSSDEYANHTNIDKRRPTLVAFSFDGNAVSDIEGVAKKAAAQISGAGGVRIYESSGECSDNPMFIAFRNKTIYTSTEQRLLSEFLEGNANKCGVQRLSESPAWKDIRTEEGVCGLVVHSGSYKATDLWQYLCFPDAASITIKDGDCNILYSRQSIPTGMKVDVIQMLQNHLDTEFGGRWHLTPLQNRLKMGVVTSDERSMQGCITYLAVATQGACF